MYFSKLLDGHGRTVMTAKPDETFEVIDLLLVATLEQLNGNSR